MSAIAGVYSRTGSPVDRDILEQLGNSLRQMGPDGGHIEATPAVGMVHRALHTYRDSRLTRQPLVGSDGIMLSWDGRLDNREDLEPLLEGDLTDDARDLEVVLATYRKWGVDGFARLIGEFALALWDPGTQRLLLVGDSFGLRPLYYHVTRGHVFWASRARSLFEVLSLPLAIQEEYIADFFTEPRPTPRSPYKGIGSVPGGHVLVADRSGADLKRYWALDPSNQIRYDKDEEYEAHFREVFRQAVASRLRSDGPVFAELSGGLDSSSIIVVGDQILEQEEVETSALHTASYVFDSSPGSDERPYMGVIEENRGQPGLHIRDEDYPILSPVPEDFRPDLPTNQLCFLARHDHLARQMREQGSRVLLRGEVGDQVLIGDAEMAQFHLADLLVQRRFGDLYRTTRSWSRVRRIAFLKLLWQGGIWPLLPRRWRARTEFLDPLEDWFDGDFARRVDLEDRMLGPVDDVGYPLPSDSKQYTVIRSGSRLYALQMCLTEDSVEARYPFFDRRLVEFMMAIPSEQKQRPGQTKSLLRRGLKGILPDPIRLRRTNTGPTEAFIRALVRQWGWLSGIVSEPRVVEHGLVDGDAFTSAVQQARHGMLGSPGQLLRTLAVELWLRSLELPAPRWTGARDEVGSVVEMNRGRDSRDRPTHEVVTDDRRIA